MGNMQDSNIFLGFGSNLGVPEKNLRRAFELVSDIPGTRILETSSFIRTLPLTGDAGGPSYVNCVARIETTQTAEDMLEELQAIEKAMGRVRGSRWEPRIIDIDILLWNDRVIETAALTVPHREMHLRSFVVEGLDELAPEVRHPLLNDTVSLLYDRLNGGDYFCTPEGPKLIAFAGVIGVGKTTLAEGLSILFDTEPIHEEYDKNPYLPMVYAGREDVRLDSELFFLNSSAEQLRSDRLTGDDVYVADFMFEKSPIYAKHWLEPADYRVLIEQYERFREDVVGPSMVIFLEDTAGHCLERIERRGRKYESQIGEEFLDELGRAYDNLFKDWRKCPVMRLDASKYDFRVAGQVREIEKKIRYYLGV